MADQPPAKKSRRTPNKAKPGLDTPDKEAPSEELVWAVAASNPKGVRHVLKAHAPACQDLLNPQSYGDFVLPADCTGGAGGGASGGAGAAGVADADASPPYCLLHWATLLACAEEDPEGPAHKIVQLLVTFGANLWGCKDVEEAMTEVVKSYLPGPSGYKFQLAESDCNDGALSVVSGFLPGNQYPGFQHDAAGCLPLHEALRRGSAALVQTLCTSQLLNDMRLVLLYFDEENMREGQYVSPVAFVTLWRERREDGTGLEILHLLVERMGVSPLDLQCFRAGCGGSVWPVLHGLVHAALRQPLPLPEGFVAESEKMLAFLTSKRPRLLQSFDRDCLTAIVLAASRGQTWFVLQAAQAASDIGTMLAPVGIGDADCQDDYGDTTDEYGVTVPGEELNPTAVLPAAAYAGEFDTAGEVLVHFSKHVDHGACEHKDIPVPILAVHAAENQPNHLGQLRRLLDACQDCVHMPMYDMDDCGPLHLAAWCKPLGVVECVAKFATQRRPDMLTQLNREGFTPLQVAVKRVEATEQVLAETQARLPVFDPDVQACTADRDEARAVAAFLCEATRH